MSDSRWAAYAIAGAASAIAGATSAEADIHYSGIINQHLVGPMLKSAMFPLDAGITLTFLQKSGFAEVEINDGSNGAFVAPPQFYTSLRVSNLSRGVPLSRQIFRDSCFGSSTTFTCRAKGIIGEAGSTSGQFNQRGVGCIGFEFNRGAGVQYGWARIKTTGDPDYKLIIVDYAWGDPRQRIKTGQKEAQQASTESKHDIGSLGLLALGATGLLACRQSRKNLRQ